MFSPDVWYENKMVKVKSNFPGILKISVCANKVLVWKKDEIIELDEIDLDCIYVKDEINAEFLEVITDENNGN